MSGDQQTPVVLTLDVSPLQHDRLSPAAVTARLDHGPSPIVGRIAEQPIFHDNGTSARYVFVVNQPQRISASFARFDAAGAAAGWNNVLILADDSDVMTLRHGW